MDPGKPGTWVGTSEQTPRTRRRSSESVHLLQMLADEVEAAQSGPTDELRRVVMGALARAMDYGREIEREDTIAERQRADLAEAQRDRLREMHRRKDPRRE